MIHVEIIELVDGKGRLKAHPNGRRTAIGDFSSRFRRTLTVGWLQKRPDQGQLYIGHCSMLQSSMAQDEHTVV